MTEDEIKALLGELEATKAELGKVRQEKETLGTEFASRDARISEFEQTLAAKDAELVAERQKASQLEDKLGLVSKDLGLAVSSYRDLVVQANPGVVEDLIGGDSIEAVNQSLEKARTLIGRVKKNLEADRARTRVPAGAPERTSIDLSGLSSRDKIRYAIGGK